MAKAWHKKHIPTQWGVAILGFLVVSTALLIPYLNQVQSLRSDAATPVGYGRAGTCANLAYSVKGQKVSAKCQFTSSPCAGAYVNNYCGGGNDYKCCVLSPSCAKEGGVCVTVTALVNKAVADKKGKLLNGYCPGPNNVKCYVPNSSNSRGGGRPV